MGESWSAHLGEEVEKVAPDAVTRDADGGIRIDNQKLYRETALKLRMDAQAKRAEEQAQAKTDDPINQTNRGPARRSRAGWGSTCATHGAAR